MFNECVFYDAGGAEVPEQTAGCEGSPGAIRQHQPQLAELRPVPQSLLRQRVRGLGSKQPNARPLTLLTAESKSIYICMHTFQNSIAPSYI